MPRDPRIELFDSLFETHRRRLYAYLYGRTGSATAAEDLLQEVFLRVWRRISDLIPLSEERRWFWILAVARNAVIDHHRRASVRESREVAAAGGESTSESGDPQHILQSGQEMEALDRAIQRLPEELRTVLVLSAMEGLSSAELGNMLNRPAATVRYHLAKARKLLAKELNLAAQDPVPSRPAAGPSRLPSPPLPASGGNKP